MAAAATDFDLNALRDALDAERWPPTSFPRLRLDVK
jgi:hypothetical protein